MGKSVVFIGPNGFRDRRLLRSMIPEKIELHFVKKQSPPYPDCVEKAAVVVNGRPDSEFYEKAVSMKVHVIPFAGVQHVTEKFGSVIEKCGITLLNAHWNRYFVSQHAVALLLAISNRIISQHEKLKKGVWRVFKDDDPSIPIRKKRIGLLGYGNINRGVHKILSAFEAEFSILKNSWTETQKKELDASLHTPETVNSFLNESDIIVVAVPVTPATRGLLHKKRLELLGSEGILINVARGEIIPEADLFYALRDKKIKAAAIDVWYDYNPLPDNNGKKYPYSAEHPFHELDNIILSPHRGASPLNDSSRWDEVVENILRFFRGEKLSDVVDIKKGY
ncbi:MAG: NAD(P)-dependent oxidoreductase [bacterium]